jgi:hypothetical protein
MAMRAALGIGGKDKTSCSRLLSLTGQTSVGEMCNVGGDDFSKESTPPSYSTTITIQNGGGAGNPAPSGPTPTEMKQQLADLQQQQQKIILEQQQHLLLKQQQILQQQTKLSSSTSYSTSVTGSKNS